jgi:hypothetical protein
MEQLGTHWTDVHEIDIWVFFENMLRKFKFHQTLARVTVVVHPDQFTHLIISR